MLQNDITSALTAQGAAGEQGIIERTISALIESIKAIFRLIFAPFRMILDGLTGTPETPPPPEAEPAQPPYMLIAVFIIAVIAVITYIHFMRELKKDEDGTHADIAEPDEEPEAEIEEEATEPEPEDQQDPEEPDAAVLDDFSTITPTLNGQKTPENEDETAGEKQEEIEEAEAGVEPSQTDRSFSDSKNEEGGEDEE